MTRKKKVDLMKLDFANLVGLQANLYLCPPNTYQFQLGAMLFEVEEDESDGYRSSVKETKVISITAPIRGRALAKITIKDAADQDLDGYDLIDEEGHTWLSFGTNNSDSYYPGFVFNWQPKVPEDVKAAKILLLK